MKTGTLKDAIEKIKKALKYNMIIRVELEFKKAIYSTFIKRKKRFSCWFFISSQGNLCYQKIPMEKQGYLIQCLPLHLLRRITVFPPN